MAVPLNLIRSNTQTPIDAEVPLATARSALPPMSTTEKTVNTLAQPALAETTSAKLEGHTKDYTAKTVDELKGKIEKTKAKIAEAVKSGNLGEAKKLGEKVVVLLGAKGSKETSLLTTKAAERRERTESFVKVCLDKTPDDLSLMQKEKMGEYKNLLTEAKEASSPEIKARKLDISETAHQELNVIVGAWTIKTSEFDAKTLKDPAKLDALAVKAARAHIAIGSVPSSSKDPKVQSFNSKVIGLVAQTTAQNSQKSINRLGGGSGGIYALDKKMVFKSVLEEPGMPLARDGLVVDEEEQKEYPPGQGPVREFAAASSPLSPTLAALVPIESDKIKQEDGGEVSPKKGIVTLMVPTRGPLEDFATHEVLTGSLKQIKESFGKQIAQARKDPDPEVVASKVKELEQARDGEINTILGKLNEQRRELYRELGANPPPATEKPDTVLSLPGVNPIIPFDDLKNLIYDRCPPEEIQRNKIMDLCYINTDANLGNELLDLSKPGEVHVISIDRGKTLPKTWNGENNFNIGNLASNNNSALRAPVNDNLKEELKNFNLDTEVGRLNSLFRAETGSKMEPEQEKAFRAHVTAVKVGVEKGFTLQEISDYTIGQTNFIQNLKLTVDQNTKKDKVDWKGVETAILAKLTENRKSA